MSKKILGLVGPIASGKGEIKKYLIEKYGAADCRFSTVLRDVLSRIKVDHSRANLQKISTILRENFGEDVLAKVLADDAKNFQSEYVVVDGVRRMADIKYLKELDGFVLIAIDADQRLRYKRMILRNENHGEAEKTFEQFVRDEGAESDREIPEVMKHAEITLENNGDLANLHRQLDSFLQTLEK